MHRIVHAAIAALMASQAQAALAASVFLQTGNDNQYSFSGYGAAFGDVVDTIKNSVAHASAFEFKGGVAVTTLATANGAQYGGGAQAFANAASSSSFFVNYGMPGLDDVGGITGLLLDVKVDASGSASATNSVNPDHDGAYRFSYAVAHYGYTWNIGGQTGSYEIILGRNEDGSTTSYESDHSQLGVTLFVSLNDVVQMNWYANAEATASANGFASADAAADYGHTLKWGGVTGVRGVDSSGNEVALPLGFQVSLMSEDGEFDFINAAVNPYTSPVPEPGEWAMLVGGLALVGRVARRRRRLAVAGGALALLAATAASAETRFEVSGGPPPANAVGQCDDYSTSGTSPVLGTGGCLNPGGNSTGTSEAGWGKVEAYAQADGVQVYATSADSRQDLLFTSSDPNATSTSVALLLHLEGLLNGDGYAFSQMSGRVVIGGTSFNLAINPTGSTPLLLQGLNILEGAVNQNYGLTDATLRTAFINVPVNVPVELQLSITARAAGTTNLSSAAGPLMLGVQRDANAFVLEDGVTVNSGDWLVDNRVTPAPEPGEWAMVIVGLGVVGAAARRRRRAA